MKILVIIPSLARGGAERVVSLLSQEWARQHDVTIALFDGRNPAYRYGGRLVDLDCPAGSGVRSKISNAVDRILRLRQLLRKDPPDYVLTFMESANFPAIIACALTGQLSKLKISVHNNPASFPKRYRRLFPVMYRLPAKVIAVSGGIREALVTQCGIPADKALSIPNPVDLHEIGEQTQVADQSQSALQIEGPYLIAVGRLARQKGFDMLIKAYAEIHARIPFKLLILGEGSERAILEAQIKELGLQEKVLLPGSVTNPFYYLSRATAFVLSSRNEGWPMVLMEAMASRCPVISFDCSYGPGEIIRHQSNGWLVEAGNVTQLAEAIEHVTMDINLRQKIADNGYLSIKAFDVKQIATAWL